MRLLELTSIAATLLCALVAGFVFAFAAVVMPGIGTLDDRTYWNVVRTVLASLVSVLLLIVLLRL